MAHLGKRFGKFIYSVVFPPLNLTFLLFLKTRLSGSANVECKGESLNLLVQNRLVKLVF